MQAPGSQSGQIEVHGGVIPGFGGTWRLPRRVGERKVRELLYQGLTLDADAAKACGLVTEVFDRTELLERVQAVAASIASMAPLAVRAAKQMLVANADLSLQASNKLERQIFSNLFGTTADQQEGMNAFLEKRAPKFIGA